MNSSKIVLRINAANPNHHLWNNNGTWSCHYTVQRPNFTKHRIQMSLQTSNLPPPVDSRTACQSYENNQGAS
jgi:hypothetical protein